MGSVIEIPYDYIDEDLMLWGKRAEPIIKKYRANLDQMSSTDEKKAFVNQKIKELYPDD